MKNNKFLTFGDSSQLAVWSFNFLNKVTQTLTSKSNLKETLKIIMHNINTLLKPKIQIIHLFNPENQALESYASENGKDTEIKKNSQLINKERIMKFIENGEVLITPSKNNRHISKSEMISIVKEIPKSILCLPMISREKPFGAIELIDKIDGSEFNEDDLKILNSIKDIIAIIIQNQILYEKNLELSTIDEVSGLYNLKYFKQVLRIEVKRANRLSKPFSLIFFDLDFFKDINDSHGHQVGSRVLSKIGELLKDNLRETDISARYGGDEFVIILPHTNETNAKIVAEKLRKLFSNTTFSGKDGVTLKITASFGIATYPTHSTDPEVLLELSDKAMYMVKKSGRNGVIAYPK